MAELRNAKTQSKVESIRGKLAAPIDHEKEAVLSETREAEMETDDALGNLAMLERQFKENDSGEIEAIVEFRKRRDELAKIGDQMKDADREIVEARSADSLRVTLTS